MIKVNLKSLLKDYSITLTELSKMTGISLKALSSFQNQKTDGVQYNTIDKIVKALNIPIGNLIEYIDTAYRVNVSIEYTDKTIVQNHISTEKFIGSFTLTNDSEDHLTLPFSFYLYSVNHLNKKTQFHIEMINFKTNELATLDMSLFNYSNEYEYNRLHQLLNIFSHLLVQQLIFIKHFNKLSMDDTFMISWKNLFPILLVEDINSDTVEFMSEKIRFSNFTFKVNLGPMDPNSKFKPHQWESITEVNAFVESIKHLYSIYKFEINPDTFERIIYIKLD